MSNFYDTSLSRETRKIYWEHTKRYPKLLITMLVSRPIYLLCAYIGNVYITGVALDKLREHTQFNFWTDFGAIIAGLVIFVIGQIIFEYLSVRCIWTLEAKVMRDLATRAYEKLMHESADFHANHFTGSLVSQTNKFVGAFDRLSETLYWQVYSFFINVAFTIILLGPRLPAYTAVLCGLLTIFFYVSIKMNRRGKIINTKIANAENKMTGQLADSIGNILAVKSFGQEATEQKRFSARLNNIFKANMEARRYHQRKDAAINIPVTSATILAVVFSIVAATKNVAPLSTILIATVLTRDLFMRAREFNVNSQRNIARAFGDAHEMTQILLSETTINDMAGAKSLEIKNASIHFRAVNFTYKDNKKQYLFQNFNLTVTAGEKIGLIGPSGGGKTTITKLLLRFMEIESGSIEIDTVNLSEVKQQELRQQIAYVPQEPLLFHRSLAENISYGKPDATEAEIKNAAKLSRADEFIEKLPEKYETLVGERGVKLSGGQKQRIAIARAMLKNSPILVLDEATSALDSESEVLIQEALKNLMQGKTTIVIAHRLSTIQKMDRIIVLNEGKIVEEGKHSELVVKKNGLYARLWGHQSGGFLVE